MSEKYKEALDKIVVTDELKEKIIEKARTKQTTTPVSIVKKPKYMRNHYLRHFAGMAACFLICISAVFTGNDAYCPDISSVKNTPIPQTTQSANQEYTPNKAVNTPIQESIGGSEAKNIPSSNVQNILPKNSNNSIKTETQSVTQNVDTKKETENSVPKTVPQIIPQMSIGEASKEDTDDEVMVQSTYGEDTETVNNAECIEDLQKQAGYVFKLPQYIPEGYSLSDYGVLFGSIIEINYKSADNNILYRTEKTDGNISGDYNNYSKVETVLINDTEVTVKGEGDLYYNAVWNDNSAYGLNIDGGLDKETVIDIVESVDYPPNTALDTETKAETDGENQSEINKSENNEMEWFTSASNQDLD